MPSRQPPAPVRPTVPPLDAVWTAANPSLYQSVRDAIAAVPTYFRTETVISGIMAPDLFTLNSVLGAAIEEQTVATLNAMRQVWAPSRGLRLVQLRSPVPDLPGRAAAPRVDGRILLGIELKGWYLLARGGAESAVRHDAFGLQPPRPDRRRAVGAVQRHKRVAGRVHALRRIGALRRSAPQLLVGTRAGSARHGRAWRPAIGAHHSVPDQVRRHRGSSSKRFGRQFRPAGPHDDPGRLR